MRNQSEIDVAIVGGGIGGIVAALLLRNKGCRVTIYEKESRLGGRLAFHRHDEWRIDQGPTVVLLPQMILSILEEAGVDCTKLKKQLTLCEPLARIHFADGTVFHKYHDVAQQMAEIERLSPGESVNFQAYMTDLKKMYDDAKPVFLDRAFLRKRNVLSWLTLSTLWRAKAHLSVEQLARKYFRDERLRHAFSLQTLYIGGAPKGTPGLYSLIPYAEQAYGIWYLQGGYATLAEMLTEALEACGVNVRCGYPVERLLVTGSRCEGVVVGGQAYNHDVVVYNGDYPNLQKVAGVAEHDRDQRQWQPSSGCVLLYLMADCRWEQLTTHQFFLPSQFDEQLDTIFKQSKVPSHPAYYVFQPQTIDETVAPSGKTLLYVLIPVPTKIDGQWSEVAEQLSEQVLLDLQTRALPGLMEHIEWLDIRTPADAQSFGLYGGGSFGLAPTWSQSAIFRPQIKHREIEGLYAVGASVHPGGGIPIVMQGAKLMAEHLLKEMRV